MMSCPRGFKDTGSSQVQVDSCFRDCLRVIGGGEDTYRFLETMPQIVFMGLEWAFGICILTLCQGNSGEQSGFGTTRLGSCSWGSETWRDSLSSTRRENVFNTHPWAKHLFILRQILSLHHVPCNLLGVRNTAEIRQYSSCSKGLTVVLVGVGSRKKAKKERNQII